MECFVCVENIMPKENLLGVDYLNSGFRNVEIQIIVEMEKLFFVNCVENKLSA